MAIGRRAKFWKENGRWRVALTDNGVVRFVHRHTFDELANHTVWHLTPSIRKWSKYGKVTNKHYHPYFNCLAKEKGTT